MPENPVPPTGPASLPEWLETPGELSYTMEVWNAGGDSEQTIEMSRLEFIELKRHLARIRGYEVESALAG